MKISRIIWFVVVLLTLALCQESQAGFWSSAPPPPARIALLLPLNGQYGDSSKAIRDGFLAAYYQSLPADPTPPTIRVVDTSSGDIVGLYKQAVADGAKMIVGPLSKDEGAQLVQAGQLTVPTLFLNTLPGAPAVANLYQLSLSPEDEIKQVADRAWQDGRRNAAIIIPASSWGQRINQVFLTEWQKLGGKIVGAMYYNTPEQLAGQVAQLLQVDESEKRAKSLQRLLQQTKMRTIPYRRQDVDAIILVANPEFARELRPLLSFYYAAKIPVYATSHIYSGIVNSQLDQDLDGVMFCAIPWEIDTQDLSPSLQAVLKSIQTTWGQASKTQPQFFALGVDGYRLARQLAGGNLAPETAGAIGKLTLQENRIWYRELPWAKMVRGQPELLSEKAPEKSVN
jgi:uncharacterized protein